MRRVVVLCGRLLASIAFGSLLVGWQGARQDKDHMSVVDSGQVLVKDPAENFDLISGPVVSFAKAGSYAVEVVFERGETPSALEMESFLGRVRIYKWTQEEAEIDCSDEECWTKLHQFTSRGPQTKRLRVKAGDKWLIGSWHVIGSSKSRAGARDAADCGAQQPCWTFLELKAPGTEGLQIAFPSLAGETKVTIRRL